VVVAVLVVDVILAHQIILLDLLLEALASSSFDINYLLGSETLQYSHHLELGSHQQVQRKFLILL